MGGDEGDDAGVKEGQDGDSGAERGEEWVEGRGIEKEGWNGKQEVGMNCHVKGGIWKQGSAMSSRERWV